MRDRFLFIWITKPILAETMTCYSQPTNVSAYDNGSSDCLRTLSSSLGLRKILHVIDTVLQHKPIAIRLEN